MGKQFGYFKCKKKGTLWKKIVNHATLIGNILKEFLTCFWKEKLSKIFTGKLKADEFIIGQ